MLTYSPLKELSKLIGNIYDNKTIHSHENLERIIDTHLFFFDNEMMRNAIYPAKMVAFSFFGILKDFKKDVQNKPDYKLYWYLSRCCFNFDTSRIGVDKILKVLNNGIPKIEEKISLFEKMKGYVLNHIELEILPNEDFDGERIYLAQGKLIMPTTIKSFGYHIFDILVEEVDLEFKPLTEYGFDSIGGAMKMIDLDIFGTIAIAKNTEKYPLYETSLPVIREKYGEGLGMELNEKNMNYSIFL